MQRSRFENCRTLILIYSSSVLSTRMDANVSEENMKLWTKNRTAKSPQLVLNISNISYDSMENLDGFGQEFIYSLGFVYCLICVVGLAGNILVFYVVCRFSSMHTVTNVYILALALADIAFLVNVPFLVATSVLGDWPFGAVYCKIYYSVTTINQFASSFFLVVMSADRYFAVCHPTLSRQFRTTNTAVIISVIVWLFAITLMYPVFRYSGTGVDEEPTEPDEDLTRTQCNILWPPSETLGIDGSKQFALYGFVLGFALPVALMVTFYGMVLRHLRSSHEKVASATSACLPTANASHSRRRSKLRRVTMMIFVLVLVYVLCWTPYWSLQIHIIFADATAGESTDIIVASLSLQCLCFFNSACNPVLYAILSDNFKKSYSRAFKKLAHNGHSPLTSPVVMANGKPRDSMIDSDACFGEPTIASVSVQPHMHTQVKLQKEVLFRVGDGILVLL